jgi:hypothetical protein
VEKNIHQKRHLFPNPLLQHYPANLRRQGNAPAESNHSSIVRRLGPSFYDSPVSLIGALLQRHADISAERHNFLQTYHLRVCTNTPRLPDGGCKKSIEESYFMGNEAVPFLHRRFFIIRHEYVVQWKVIVCKQQSTQCGIDQARAKCYRMLLHILESLPSAMLSSVASAYGILRCTLFSSMGSVRVLGIV